MGKTKESEEIPFKFQICFATSYSNLILESYKVTINWSNIQTLKNLTYKMTTFFLFFPHRSMRFTKHSSTTAGLRRIAPYLKLALALNTKLFGQFETEIVESVQALDDTSEAVEEFATAGISCGYRKGLGGI